MRDRSHGIFDMTYRVFLAAACVAATVAPVSAANVSLSGTVLNSCILAVPTTGLLVADSAGTTLRSDTGVGARAASLTVVSIGAAPTLTFAAPQYSGPSGVPADSVQYSYAAVGSGASRGFASTGATASVNLIDTVVINGKIARAAGFSTGTYAMTVDVTCGQ